MKILVLNRFPLELVPYDTWFGPGNTVVLLTRSGAGAAARGYAEVVEVPGYDDSARVEYHAHRLHGRYGFDRVVAYSEWDLLRAARLRAAWGLPGQSPDSALAYRDKLVMKELLAAAGVPVARFAAVDDASALLAFADFQGLPLVLKPRRGASSMGVEVVRDEAALRRFLETCPDLAGDRPAHLMAEALVPNEMFNVDGMVVDGRVWLCWPSSTTSALGFQNGECLVAATLDPADPDCARLTALVKSALAALPTPPTSAFHAEVFKLPDGSLMLNEIGSRMGGAHVQDQLLHSFGVDPLRLQSSWLVGADLPRTPAEPAASSGYALIPPRPGRLVRAPRICPLPGIALFEVAVEDGTALGEARSSVDSLASFVAVGRDRDEVLETLWRAVEWFTSACVFEPDEVRDADAAPEVHEQKEAEETA
ncbi:ATP-grasp domain-containing protein [Streptomyces virginiae]|uniref:ATP-grasp domain-containing protein n=1 Tax=Streptomyces virginiae TaxID=1961 RepID=UPI003719F479